MGASRSLPDSPARFGTWSEELLPSVRSQLDSKGILTPYRHQAEAIDRWIAGEDVAILTGTNSGKSLAYQVPTLQTLLSEPAARVLYLFPTKALAQDQYGRLEQLLPPGFYAAIYDGDTAKTRRSTIRQTAHVVLTNPDMLHVGMLPYHELWIKFFRSLRLIVLDEVHTYKGVFGSHVAGVLRRLLRLCAWHGANPSVIAASATVADPEVFLERLTGRKMTVVDRDGSPKAVRHFMFWNPSAPELKQPLSANHTCASLLCNLVEEDLTGLCFSRSRIGAELVLRYAREMVPDDVGKKLESYRGGYTPKERRTIEQALFKGKLKGLSATNALELGVDVGGLDAVIMNGYPGSISSFWQQAGRAGRGTREGLALMVAREDPLDQFFFREPSLILDGTPESVSIRLENPFVLGQQLRCAAYERPLAATELFRFGETALDVAESMDAAGELKYVNGMFFLPTHESPAPSVGLRGTGSGEIVLKSAGEVLGTMDRNRALQQAHAGAVYLHRGQTYVVSELDLAKKEASLSEAQVDYYTRPVVQALLESRVDLDLKPSGIASITYCGVTVTDSVLGYRKLMLTGQAASGVEPLDLPISTYDTLAFRVEFPNFDDGEAALLGLHGVEHALLALAPWLAGCDRSDLGSAWYGMHHQTLKPTLFLFDRTPGGVGLSENLYRHFDTLVGSAIKLVQSCSCKDGCPSCLLLPNCESNNEHLGKPETIQLLRALYTGS